MEGWQWAIVLKPFGMLLLMGGIVLPIELLLRRFIPESSLKRILFDRTFPEKHPVQYMIVWVALMVLLWGSIWFFYWREGL